jgi:hypothetical protein
MNPIKEARIDGSPDVVVVGSAYNLVVEVGGTAPRLSRDCRRIRRAASSTTAALPLLEVERVGGRRFRHFQLNSRGLRRQRVHVDIS